MTLEDIKLMRTGTFDPVSNNLNKSIFLFHKNADVDVKNTEILLSMTMQSAPCTVIDRPSGNVTTEQANTDLRRVQRLAYTDTIGLPTDLFLRIDARYMVTTNIDTSNRVVMVSWVICEESTLPPIEIDLMVQDLFMGWIF